MAIQMNKYCLHCLLLVLVLTACAPPRMSDGGGGVVVGARGARYGADGDGGGAVTVSLRDCFRHVAGAGKAVAVSYIYDEENGNVTALGEHYRKQLERELLAASYQVKTRQDLNLLLQESESFGFGFDVDDMERLRADIVYSGSYRLDNARHAVVLNIKATQVEATAIVATFECREALPLGWARLAASIRGNVYQQQVRELNDASAADKPPLQARLDRNPACYAAGDAAQITVATAPGCYVYLLSLAADNSVTLLYPNSVLPQQPLVDGKLVFPPPALARHWQLLLYPLSANETNSEVIKVIASRQPIDFTYLPIPENQIYRGAQGGDIRAITSTLQQVRGWNEVTLPYMVGRDCVADK